MLNNVVIATWNYFVSARWSTLILISVDEDLYFWVLGVKLHYGHAGDCGYSSFAEAGSPG